MKPGHPTSVPAEATGGRRTPQRLDTQLLFAGLREVILVHHGAEYRSQITRQQKLILTK